MNISSRCSVKKRIIALLVSLCLAAAFVPSVGAASENDPSPAVDSSEFIIPVEDADTQAPSSTTQPASSVAQTTESTAQVTSSTTEATKATEQTTDATTQTTTATESTTTGTNNPFNFRSSSANSSRGFENVETDGGVLFVGTARTPRDGGGISTVKFVYSSSLNLNDKSLALINTELAACGVTIPNGMIYVSSSDIVSDSQLMTATSERQAVFAIGSPSAPTVLTPRQAYGSVEESFERLFRGYIFSISGYTSLRPLLEGREEVTLSDDGQTASTSIVMSEDYVEKVINGKKIKILMINSELKYYFRAPKLVFEKDEDYNVSDSDIIYHYPTRSTTDPSDTLTSASTERTNVTTDPFSDDDTAPTTPTTADVSSDTTASSEPTEPTEPTRDDDSTTSTQGTDPFWDDDPTEPTRATTPSTEDDWQSTSTESTHANVTHANPNRLIPYAQPIEPRPSQIVTDPYPTETMPTKRTTEPTTESTTEPTSIVTLPTATQPTRHHDESVLDPFNQREQHSVGEAYINTRRLPLNIRTGPGLNYMVITVLPKGTHLTVLDTSNPDWYMVRLNNRSIGYAYSYYIKFE